MNTDDEVKFPKFKWERVLLLTVIWLVGLTFLAAALRSRTLLIVSELATICAILALLAFATYAAIKAYTKPKK